MRIWTRATLLATALLASCVSSSAGYDRMRAVVEERTGEEVSWRGDGDDEEAAIEAPEGPLTADAAARHAALGNPNARAAIEQLGIDRANLTQALALPNPRVEAAMHFHDDEEVEIDIDAGIDVTHFVLLPLREAAASAALDASSIAAAGSVLDTMLDAKIAFYEYQAARQIVELRGTVTFAMAQSADLARRLREAGNITELDALNERALFEETRIGLAQAEVDEVVARERANASLGLWGKAGAAWTVEGRLADPPAKELAAGHIERVAVAKSLDLEEVRLRHASAARRSDLANATGWIPKIEAGVSVEHEAEAWGIGPQVAATVPLFYQNQGEVQAADADTRVQEQLHSALATRIRATARALSKRLHNARERVAYYKDTLLPLRQRIVDETERQYNAMNVGAFQLLAAKRDQIETARAYIESLRDYWIARTRVDFLLAGRLSGGALGASDMAARGAGAAAPRDEH